MYYGFPDQTVSSLTNTAKCYNTTTPVRKCLMIPPIPGDNSGNDSVVTNITCNYSKLTKCIK